MSTLLACGINHQTAPLALREQLVFAQDTLHEPLHSLIAHTQGAEAAILSTCNRTEFYCVDTDPLAIVDWLHTIKQLPTAQLQNCIYVHRDEAAVRHLLRVTSGLDSIIVGETQIAQQVKKAFAQASAAGTLGAQLQRLANYVFSVNKQVRSQTDIGVHPVSLASAAVNFAEHIFADLKQATVLLVGAGETNQLFSKYMQAAGVEHFIVANRTQQRGEKLARQLNGQAIALNDIGLYLERADIVSAATESPVPIIGKGMVESVLKVRKRRPLLMIDLAVPRDIEPEIAQLDDIYLSTLEDLQAMVVQNMQGRRESAVAAEAIIETQVKHYAGILRVVEAAPAIAAYRKSTETIGEQELQKALQRLSNGMEAEQVLRRFAEGFSRKVLHAPSVKLRQAAYAKQEEVLKIAQWLLDN